VTIISSYKRERIHCLVVRSQASQADEALVVDAMDFWHITGDRLCLCTETQVAGQGHTVLSYHSQTGSSIVLQNGLDVISVTMHAA